MSIVQKVSHLNSRDIFIGADIPGDLNPVQRIKLVVFRIVGSHSKRDRILTMKGLNEAHVNGSRLF